MKFLIVGTNFISDMLCEAISQSTRSEAVAVYSRTRERGEEFAKRHNIKKVYTDYTEALADGDIGAVYVASPIFKHCEQSIAAMKAGKHVLCEKMMAASFDEFYMMKESSEKYGRVLLEAMRPAHDPAIDIVRENLPRLGKIEEAHFEFSKYSSRYDSFKSGIVLNAFDPRIKNSAISDIGIYPLFYALYLFGMPRDVFGASRLLSNGFEGEGDVILNYGEMSVSVVYSKIRDNDEYSYIKGSGGTLYIDKVSAPTKIVFEDKGGKRTALDYSAPSNNMVFELSAFVDMCEGKRPHDSYLSIAESEMIIIDRIYRERKIAEYFLG